MPEDSTQKRLVVLVRGWINSTDILRRHYQAGEFSPHLVSRINELVPNSLVVAPNLPMEMLSTATPDEIVEQLLTVIDNIDKEESISDIVLVGYSSGAPLVRSVYCRAWGTKGDGSIDLKNARSWATKISRMVSLAGITRGWKISSATPHLERFLAPVFLLMAKFICRLKGGKLFVLALKRGAPFIVRTKLEYLALSREFERPGSDKSNKLADTVFLLGSRDQFISPIDSMDLGVRSELIYIEVESSGHEDLLKIVGEARLPKLRAELVRKAITAPTHELAALAISSDDVNDHFDPLDRPVLNESPSDYEDVGHVVIILHGIRDNGHWTKRLAREVRKAGRAVPILIRAPTPTYGFFSMWDFIRPVAREDAAYWLLERIGDIRVYYPNAKISFVGHSNGTFLAARALEVCESVSFNRVLFAGSVVRTDFGWQKYQERVESVVNYVADGDLVVACLPGTFERMGLRFLNVGGAGYSGFSETKRQAGDRFVNNVKFVKGGHGSAIAEPFWQEIAEFIVNGEQPNSPPNSTDSRMVLQRRVFFKVANALGPAIVIGGVVSVYFLFAWMVNNLSGWTLPVAFSAAALLIFQIIRFY